MMANKTLTKKTGYYLYPIGLNLECGQSVEVDIEIPMIIDAEEKKSGYMLLYGSNEDVGNYQINGIISRNEYGIVTYDLTYTFNDVMDPEFKYDSDVREYSKVVFLKSWFDSNITMNDYNIHISWSDKTVYNYSMMGKREGWLAGMEEFDIEYYRDAVKVAKEIEPIGTPDYETALLTEAFINQYINFVNNHPEYYGCTLE